MIVRINPLQPPPGSPTHPGQPPSLGYDPLVSKGQICRLSLGRIPTGIYFRAYCNSQYGDHTGPTRDCRNNSPLLNSDRPRSSQPPHSGVLLAFR